MVPEVSTLETPMTLSSAKLKRRQPFPLVQTFGGSKWPWEFRSTFTFRYFSIQRRNTPVFVAVQPVSHLVYKVDDAEIPGIQTNKATIRYPTP